MKSCQIKPTEALTEAESDDNVDAIRVTIQAPTIPGYLSSRKSLI